MISVKVANFPLVCSLAVMSKKYQYKSVIVLLLFLFLLFFFSLFFFTFSLPSHLKSLKMAARLLGLFKIFRGLRLVSIV